MQWHLSNRFDKRACTLADRHYSRQKPGTPQFVAPGRCIVLLTADASALWVSSWPYGQYTHHAWAGAWICSLFRNEGPILSSDLIRQAISATRAIWQDTPDTGMITFIDPAKIRRKRDPGRCFLKAGFMHAGHTTTNNLLVLQILPNDMPDAVPPDGLQASML